MCVTLCWFSFININVKHVDLNFEPVYWHISYFERLRDKAGSLSILLCRLLPNGWIDRWLDDISSYKHGFHFNLKVSKWKCEGICFHVMHGICGMLAFQCPQLDPEIGILSLQTFLWVLWFLPTPPNMLGVVPRYEWIYKSSVDRPYMQHTYLPHAQWIGWYITI